MRKTARALQPLLLAALLTAGFAVVWGAAGGWLWEVVGSPVRDGAFGDALPGPEYLVIRANGTPLVKRFGPHEWVETYHDLEGSPVTPADEKWLYPRHLAAHGADGLPWLPAELREDCWRETPWGQRLRAFADDRQDPQALTFWWLVADDRVEGTTYLVGYHRAANARVGYLGTAGFRGDEPPPDERFRFTARGWAIMERVRTLQTTYPGANYPTQGLRPVPTGDVPPWYVYLLADDGKVHQIDLGRRAVRAVLEDTPVRSIDLAPRNSPPSGPAVFVLVARTDDELLELDADNEVVGRFPIPEELRGRGFYWTETATGEFIAYTREPVESDWGSRFRYYWLDRAGRVTRRTEFTLRGYNRPYVFAQRTLAGLLAPSSAAVVAFAGVYRPLALLDNGVAHGGAEAWALALSEQWPSLLLGLAVSAGLAWACYRRQVRYRAGAAERIFWPLFVLLLGLPGWVGYRYGRSWPPLAPCPVCGTDVPQDRPACAACQGEFSSPALTGTEVFA
jgi:hypothetical protein